VVNRVVHAADGSSGRAEAIALVLLAVCGQEDDADFLFLDRGLVGLLDAGPDLGDVEALGGVGGDCDGLDEELVFAAGVERRVFFHGLQENLDLDIAPRFDAARVWAHAVPGRIGLGMDGLAGDSANILLWCSSLDFEGNGLVGRVGQAQDLGDLVGERACICMICQLGNCKLAVWTEGDGVAYA
jgi:hypothetical protein